jgi:long-subunit fatty acid transport protein
MKHIMLFSSFYFFSVQVFAQEPADALRYSWLTPSGTARSQAIGGAIVALGGDLTAMFVNPAGIGLYKTKEIVLTPGYGFEQNKTGYLNNIQKKKDNHFIFGTSGFILPNGVDTDEMFMWGIAVNQAGNFNNSISLSGLNAQSSYSEKYLEELINKNVTDPNDAANNFPYGSSLAFNTFLIDTLQGLNGLVDGYRTLATPGSGVNQHQSINTSGSMTDFAISVAVQSNDIFYLGASLNMSFIDYKRNSLYRESDATSNTTNYFNYFEVEEYLRTKGTGANGKIGIIFKPKENIRVGLVYHTKTLFLMEDQYATTVTTDVEGYAGNGPGTQSSRDFNNGDNGKFEYGMENPRRIMAGISYLFREDRDIKRQRGFISADIEWVNYKVPNFYSLDLADDSDHYFDAVNESIDKLYKSAFNYRLGAELKFKTVMVRGGFAWFGNPYQPDERKGSKMNISGGLGYRDKGKFIDLTYVHQVTKDSYYPYRLEQGFYSAVNVNSGTGNILLTVGFKF